MFRTIGSEAAVQVLGVGEVLLGTQSQTFDVAPATFRRGDVNGDGHIDIADPISLLSYLHLDGPAPFCADAADGDDDGSLLVTDAIVLLNYITGFGAFIPVPGPLECGADPTTDEIAGCLGPCM